MRRILLSLACTASLLPAGVSAQNVEFVTPTVVRVRWNPENRDIDNATGSCIYHTRKPSPWDFKVEREENGGNIVYRTDSLIVTVSPEAGITFIDRATGKALLTEGTALPRRHERVAKERITYDESSARMEETANGKVTVKDILRRDTIGYKDRYSVTFTADADDALYGLGAHMEDYMNLVGKTLWLTQHNLKAFVPMLVSTGGYGLLFDAGCSMKFDSRVSEDSAAAADFGEGAQNIFTMDMEAANTVDYYFIKGATPEDVVGGYRYLTGDVAMMPRHLFGYIQSKERYVSSEDIVNTLREYRRREVPIDMIVQDWNYWPQGWGYMKMNREFYPDPKALADSVHALDAKLMVSIWANPQYCPEEEDFRKRGFMLEHSVYDAFNPEARDLYWDYADKEFFSNGFDAFWCDSSEPLDGDWNRMPEPENGRPYSWNDHERRWRLNDEILSEALGAERACMYSLNHSKGIYEHWREATDRKRVVNLTRSTAAGQQRYGTIVWNGDTHASWESFRQQIPAGLNYLATGNPYWTVDVGCFFTRNDPRWFYIGEFPEGVKDEKYREFYTRMFQWGTFLPVLRSHGTDTPREIWHFGEPGTAYYDAILGMINLRYSLMPYIYSLAARQSLPLLPVAEDEVGEVASYSMARPLAFDFPIEREVYDIKDQYMFGDIMVCPVTSPGVSGREVYLPASSAPWIDFWTGESIQGGRAITAAAPLDRLPLFVKGGSIIPTTAPAQFAAASASQPVEIRIYPGADAEFMLYEDEGDNYNYLDGRRSEIPMKWDDAKKTLVIEARKGEFDGMQRKRSFSVSTPDGQSKEVTYTGKRIKVRM